MIVVPRAVKLGNCGQGSCTTRHWEAATREDPNWPHLAVCGSDDVSPVLRTHQPNPAHEAEPKDICLVTMKVVTIAAMKGQSINVHQAAIGSCTGTIRKLAGSRGCKHSA